MSGFHYKGSLPEVSPLYVERKKTLDGLIQLATTKNPEYAIIFGAPRTGKTSLIRRLRRSLQPHIPLHIIDVGQHDENFYSYIAGELIRLSQNQLETQAADVHNGDDFQRLLRALAPSVTTVFVFEHLMYVSKATLKSFADILRNTSEMRFEEGNKAFRRFCFMLTGGIELYQATGDSAVSPLKDLAKEFYLGDFLRLESDALLRYGFRQEGLPDETIALLCEKIYAQVHGHPFLTQRLGHELVERWQAASTINDDVIAESVDNLLNDDYRFAAMLDKAREEGLCDTLRKIMQMPPKLRFMRGDKKVAQLEAIGFIREEILAGKRFCIIRNTAYARRLAHAFGEVSATTPSLPPRETGKHMADKMEIFISYADEDQEYLKDLESHLAPIAETHPIAIWHKGKVMPGQQPQQEIDKHLKATRIILLLVSPSYLGSKNYLCNHEVQRAMEYKKAGAAEVIPVLLRAVYWENAPFGNLEPLPANGQPVKQWRHKDKALYDIALGVRKVVEELTAQPQPGTS